MTHARSAASPTGEKKSKGKKSRSPSPDKTRNHYLNGTRAFSLQEKNLDQTLTSDDQCVQIARDDITTEVFSWGCDDQGQLGLGAEHGQGGGKIEKGGSTSDFNQPQPRFCVYGVTIKLIACGGEHSAFVTDSNFVYTMGCNRSGQLGIRDTEVACKTSPVLVEQLQGFKIVDIACGGSHTVIATERGEAYSWGEGRYGALGTIETYNDQFRP